MRVILLTCLVFVKCAAGSDFEENLVSDDYVELEKTASFGSKDYLTTYSLENVQKHSTIINEWTPETTNTLTGSTATLEDETTNTQMGSTATLEDETTNTQTGSTATLENETTNMLMSSTATLEDETTEVTEGEVHSTTESISQSTISSTSTTSQENENNSEEIPNACSLCKYEKPEINNLEIKNINATAVLLSWDPIEEKTSNCIYTYTINSTSSRTTVPYFRTETETNHLYTNLKICEKYDVVIEAHNLCDFKASKYTTFYTDPEEVENVSIKVFKTYSEIKWPDAISPHCSKFRVTINNEVHKTTSNGYRVDRDLYCLEVKVQTIRTDGILGKAKEGCGKPGPIRNLQIDDGTSGQLMLKWEPPEVEDCVDSYEIVLLEPNENKEPERIPNILETSYTLDELNACSTYLIRITVHSLSMDGDESDPVEKSATVKEPDTLNPLQINNILYANGKVYLTWLPPKDQKKCVSKYKLQIDEEDWMDLTSTLYTHDNVIGCRVYKYKIQAITHMGHSSDVNSKTFTIPDILMAPPELKQINEAEKTSVDILVTFQSSDENNCQPSLVKTVCISNDVDTPWREKYVEAEEKIAEGESITLHVDGLSPYTKYLCSAQLQNNAGWSQSSKDIDVITEEDVPSAPRNLIQSAVDLSEKIEFKWEKPYKIPGVLTGYKLVIEPINSVHSEMKNCEEEKAERAEETFGPEQTSYVFDKALPSYRYRAKVTAKTYDFGASAEITFDTPEGVPEAPKIENTSIHVAKLPTYNASFTLKWKHPCNTRGTVNYFELTLNGYEKEEEHETTTDYPTEPTEPSTYPTTTSENEETKETETTEYEKTAEPTDVWEESTRNSKDVTTTCSKTLGAKMSTTVVNVRPQSSFEYEYTFKDLFPTYSYVLSVRTVLVGGTFSDEEVVCFDSPDGYPSPPTSILVHNSKQNHLIITWKPPLYSNGILTAYSIKIETLGPIHVIPQGCEKQPETYYYNVSAGTTDYTFSETLPNYKYAVIVLAYTKKHQGFPSTVLHATERDQPEPVRDLKFDTRLEEQEEYSASVVVSFKQPCNLNGPLVYYEIKLVGWYNTEKTEEEVRTPQLERVFPLRPKFEYNISVVAVTPGSPYWNSEVESMGFKAPSGVPPIIANSPTPELDEPKSDSVKVKLNRNMFASDAGDVEYYAILLTGADNYIEGPSYGFYEYFWPKFGYWSNDTEYVYTYQATPMFWNPFKQRSDDVAEFVLGNDANCTQIIDFCNGPLRPNTEYYMEIVGLTSGAYRIREPTVFKTTIWEELEHTSNVGKIIGIVVGVLAFVMLCGGGAFFVWRRRRVKLVDDDENSVEEGILGTQIPFNEFESRYEEMLTHEQIFQNEYLHLQHAMENITLKSEDALLPKNRKKNRYINILPYDVNRVKLNDNDDENDYINASYIKGHSKQIEYIATQGPMKSTNLDFWRMIVQEDVRLIVMVAHFIENEKEKCYHYVPEDSKPVNIGDDITIECVAKLNFATYCKRTILIKTSSLKHTISHIQFLNWPDFGCPSDTAPMIQLCNTMRSHSMDSGLIVVHCSAGVGRTGTLIAVDILLQVIRERRPINVFETVKQLREQRRNMVQTQKQYEHIYKCLYNYKLHPHEGLLSVKEPTKRISMDDGEPIYENYPIKVSDSNENETIL